MLLSEFTIVPISTTKANFRMTGSVHQMAHLKNILGRIKMKPNKKNNKMSNGDS